jgi:hypothetical protein
MKPFNLGQHLTRNEVNVIDYGAKGDGVTDDRAAIQAALNSGADRVILPEPRGAATSYKTSGTLVVPDHVSLQGANTSGTLIRCTALNVPILVAANVQRVQISNLRLGYAGTPVAGADGILLDTAFFCDLRDIWCEDVWNGIRITNAAGGSSGNHSIIGYRAFSYKRSALLVENALDINLTQFRFHATDSINGADAAISLIGGVEGFTASQGDITLGLGHSIATAGNAGSVLRGQSPWYNKFSQVFCDSSKGAPLFLRQSSHTSFTDCWFSSGGHDEAVGYASALNVAGVDMSQCSHTKFLGGEFYNNGNTGALVYNDNKFTLFEGVSIKRNHFSRTSDGWGLTFLQPGTDFMVRNCLFQRDPDTTTYRQLGSAYVDPGASDRYNISDNLLGGCTVPSDGGSGVNKRVANNY